MRKIQFILLVSLFASSLSFSQTASDFIKSARQKESQNDFKGMIVDCSKAISLKADFDSAYCLRGLAFLKTGDLKNASEDFSKTIKQNPKYADAIADAFLS